SCQSSSQELQQSLALDIVELLEWTEQTQAGSASTPLAAAVQAIFKPPEDFHVAESLSEDALNFQALTATRTLNTDGPTAKMPSYIAWGGDLPILMSSLSSLYPKPSPLKEPPSGSLQISESAQPIMPGAGASLDEARTIFD